MKQDIYAKEPNDSANYKHIKYDFYLSKTGQLCERKLALARRTNCNCLFEVFYDSTFSIFTGDTNIEKQLSAVIDINSFVWIDSTDFSKDKNRVYYFFGNSDGGNKSIVENADPKHSEGFVNIVGALTKIMYSTKTKNWMG